MKLSFWPFKRQQKSFDLDAAVAKAETAPVLAGKPVLIEGTLTAHDMQKLREAFQDRQAEVTLQVDAEALSKVVGDHIVKDLRASVVHPAPANTNSTSAAAAQSNMDSTVVYRDPFEMVQDWNLAPNAAPAAPPKPKPAPVKPATPRRPKPQNRQVRKGK